MGTKMAGWAALGVLIGSTLWAMGCGGKPAPRDEMADVARQVQDRSRAAENDGSRNPHDLQEGIRRLCGACHQVPLATSFPRAKWEHEVDRGFQFYYQSGRHDLAPPPQTEVVVYYQRQAPEELVIPRWPAGASTGTIRFRRTAVRAGSGSAAIADVLWLPATDTEPGQLWFSDMRAGDLYQVVPDPAKPNLTATSWGKLAHPAHLEPRDVDGDGRRDFLVADLGTFLPEDHDKGMITLFRRDPTSQPHEQRYLSRVWRSRLGRVADVRAADMDGDQQLDLVVAEFGWHSTGRVLFLRGRGGETPTFELTVLDPRPGAIHVPIVDLNRDGKLDVVALISQEHEVVEAYLGAGDGTFARHTIYAAPDPAFGSSSIEVVDLDRDGDFDILYTNGDMFDSSLLKPYHGVKWLENRGGFPFVEHELCALPAASRALAGDLDGDGDLDIVATAFAPDKFRAETDLAGLLWLEQTAPGKFQPHLLERGNLVHACMTLADPDRDGDLDIILGNFNPLPEDPAVSIWWNEAKKP